MVYEKAVFEVRKQEFLEMLEDKTQGDNATTLVKVRSTFETSHGGRCHLMPGTSLFVGCQGVHPLLCLFPR